MTKAQCDKRHEDAHQMIYVWYAEDGSGRIRKWDTKPFPEGIAYVLSHVALSAKERIAAVRADQAGEPISAAQAAAEIKKLVPANCRAAGTDMAVCRQWCGMAYCEPCAPSATAHKCPRCGHPDRMLSASEVSGCG